ncbi:hypothetical protein L211DRAFT_833450 [Terfezia boudieri ATCC MYA-4762]|uniref:Uncharacterized protein n=1 Tax=Terfezia boudieri ATCC MYA-4762 TaxID=1051890 RepID=A0A3N4M624_9PEZI|nr:hypothetical protein L211DRAFT_833450 [Terfezia boudieri ATCC MYA-4762]
MPPPYITRKTANIGGPTLLKGRKYLAIGEVTIHCLTVEMSAIFCCTHPRSYSPTSETGAVALPVRSLSPSYGRLKTKRTGPGRRQSRQDIEAFYQEGKRLQEVEWSRDNTSETSCYVPTCSVGIMQDGMGEDQTELLNRGIIPSGVSGRAQELDDCSHIPQNSSGKKIAAPIRASLIPKKHTSDLNTCLMKPASQMSTSSLQASPMQLISSPRTCNHEALASMKQTTIQPSHSGGITATQIEQQMAQRPFYEYRTEGSGSIKWRREAHIDDDVKQSLDIVEVSTPYNNVEALKPGKETALDTNPQNFENCCPQSSTLSKLHFNELVGRSDSPLGIGSIDRDQTPIARALNTKESCEISMIPLSSLAGRDRSRVYLDSSSSYYTSNASSFRSSIDLNISPVPPIPDGIIARMASKKILSPVPTRVIPSPKEVPTDNFLHKFKADDARKTNQKCFEVELAISHENGVVGEGDSSSNTVIQTGEISRVKDHGSSIWDTESTRRPLLTEAGKDLILAGDQEWDNGKKIGHKWTNDIKYCLDEQQIIQLSPMSEKNSRSMTFKKTFIRGVSKLRNRLNSNLKPTGALPLITTGTARHAATDGRRKFSRLHTPAKSITTDRTTIIGDYSNVATEDVIPNSEQVLANITFILPTELQLDGSYDDFQTVQEKTTSCPLSKLAPTVKSSTGVQNAATVAVSQNQYSAIYDDCVIFPFSSDGAESGNEEESKSDSLTMACPPQIT